MRSAVAVCRSWSFVVCAAFAWVGVSAAGLAPALAGDPVGGEREYCFCTTPDSPTGTAMGGPGSVTTVSWRGVEHSVVPINGETPEALMTRVRDLLIAQALLDGSGDVVGDVEVDPVSGRAVFCVRGQIKGGAGFENIGKVGAKTKDANLDETTFGRTGSDNGWFLRRVGGAALGAGSNGGKTFIKMKAFKEAVEQLFDIEIDNFLGMDINQEIIDALLAEGFDAREEMVPDGVGGMMVGFAVHSGPNGFDNLVDIAIKVDDPGITDLNVFGEEPLLHINEVDADQDGTDAVEFFELAGVADLDMTGYWVVLYNGNGDQEYFVINLAGQVVPANGYFVVGAPTVANVDLTPAGWPANNSIQNGADAIALYFDPSGLLTIPDFQGTDAATPPAGVQLMDAIVYGTADPDDPELLAALTPADPQVDENGVFNAGQESSQRRPNFGNTFDTGSYVVAGPTPGNYNAWSNENAALPGAAGFPDLVTLGSLNVGEPQLLLLEDALNNVPLGLFIGLVGNPTPFKGGTLMPVPWLKVLFSNTSPLGMFTLPWVMPAGAPAGTDIWLQIAIADPAAVVGVSLSNAVHGITP